MVFSRIQPNIRKYFPKIFLKCNQTHENIFFSGNAFTRTKRSLSFSISLSHCLFLLLYSLLLSSPIFPPCAGQMISVDTCPISTFHKSSCSSCKSVLNATMFFSQFLDLPFLLSLSSFILSSPLLFFVHVQAKWLVLILVTLAPSISLYVIAVRLKITVQASPPH